MACASVHFRSHLVVVIAILLSSIWNPSSRATLADESNTNRDALLCLKSHLSSPTGALATWNSTVSLDFCRWHGVSCARQTQPRVVVALDMEEQGLTGEIPPCISNLTSLVRIHLPSNRLSGHIPPQLGQLAGLRYLNLSSNSFRGEIPHLLASSSSLRYLSLQNNSLGGLIPPALFNSSTIREIHLRKNNLSGAIPPSTKFPSQLKCLDLTGNSLSGVVPPSVGNLSSLTELLIAQNKLQGNIPDLGKLSRLQHLDLSYNNLSGTVPPSIYNLSSLTFLGLANNNLGGTLPSDMGNTLPNIQTLVMSDNHFEGEIPASLANASNLEFFYLSKNSLTGVVPSFSTMLNLQFVMLFSNKLEAGDWTFLSSLANCTRLQKLNLGGNNLRGDLPNNYVANLPKTLNALTLRSNYISGTIPLEIGNLSNISLLYLDRNRLTGHIPSTLGQLRSLFILDLSQNMFSEKIPPSIGNLNQLTQLYLQENQLSGSIPANLASCQKLVALNLSCNTLSGSISGHTFGKLNQLDWLLDLSHNQLTGSIPLELGSLINLASLNISHNKIAGKIASTLGACVRLDSLRVEGNLLQGSIPQSLENLKGLKVLDFSQNNFSGTIPEFLQTFTSLQYLNMSNNNFEGPVPIDGVFANKSSAFVQGNPHLCANAPMEELPRCSSSSSKKRHKFVAPMLVALSAIVALPLIIGMSFLVFNVLIKRRWKSSERDDHTFMELKRLTYGDVSKATDSFSLANIVGSGQSGTVYRGRLDAQDGMVAIKVFKLDHYGALDSFIAECKALQNIRHRNLVKVITACSTSDPMGNEFKALVFDYMANGSLENRLHTKFQQYGDLSLGARISISVDIASALDYLHHQSIPAVVHCDLKPSNILFDNDDIAYISDFGLARLIRGCSSGGQSSSTTILGPRGSIGYIAPEYAIGSQISFEGDVYSYGIILLEMLTGKRPTDEVFSDGFTLRKYVDASLSQIQDILDPSLTSQMRDKAANHATEGQEYTTTTLMDICALQLLRIGLLCSAESPKDRPTIHDIFSEVIAVKEAFFSL